MVGVWFLGSKGISDFIITQSYHDPVTRGWKWLMMSLLTSCARLRRFQTSCNKESDAHLMRQCQPSVYITDCCCAETWQYVCRAPWLQKVKKYEQKMWTPQTHTVQTCATHEFYGNIVLFCGKNAVSNSWSLFQVPWSVFFVFDIFVTFAWPRQPQI